MKTATRTSLAVGFALLCGQYTAADASKPNFVVMYADDLGYGDLGCFGHPTVSTPNLDRMADEGMRFTQFYSAACVCTPSRAALMTGRLPVRSGMCSNKRRVLFPDSDGGIPEREVTLGEALQQQGYATACFGKWHLGHLPEYLPTNNGFDEYFGIPYSNDMDRVASAPKGRAAFLEPKNEYWNVPLLRNTEELERPTDQTTITKRYTEEAVRFIREHKDTPFFVYLPHSMVHVPLFRSPEFVDKSRRGLYGDTVEEIDWSMGQILDTLRELKLDTNTLVWFSSDNGPWLTFDEQGGSAGLLRMGKGSTWDGGMREPTLAWWPSKVGPGVVAEDVGSTMDIYATCVNLAGGRVPDDRIVDGVDLSPVLFGTGSSPREHIFYYRGTEVWAVRVGPFKAHYRTKSGYLKDPEIRHNPPLLFNLEEDPAEKFDIAADHPDVLERIAAVVAEHKRKLVAAPTQLERRIGRD